MLTPKITPVRAARRHSAAETNRRSVNRSRMVQATLAPNIRQKAIVGPGAPAFLTMVDPALKQMTTMAMATSPIGRAWRTGPTAGPFTGQAGGGCQARS